MHVIRHHMSVPGSHIHTFSCHLKSVDYVFPWRSESWMCESLEEGYDSGFPSADTAEAITFLKPHRLPAEASRSAVVCVCRSRSVWFLCLR